MSVLFFEIVSNVVCFCLSSNEVDNPLPLLKDLSISLVFVEVLSIAMDILMLARTLIVSFYRVACSKADFTFFSSSLFEMRLKKLHES